MSQPRNAEPVAAGAFEDVGLRPLTARSIVASTLLGTHPPRLPVRRLVASGLLFGIAEGTTRTALSRMVAAGELRAVDGDYELAGHLLERQARQDAARHLPTLPWDGGWVGATVRAERRSARDRAELRRAMAGLHLAELREGVWVRPDNLDPDRAPHAREVADRQVRWFDVRPREDPAALAAELWDLDAWARRAEALLDRLAALRPALDHGPADVLAPAFELSAAARRHLLADPMLPPTLLPHTWPGPSLRSEYDRYDAAFTTRFRRWHHAAVVEEGARAAAREP